MKAYYSTKYGGPEFAFYGELPDPVAKPGEILIDIKAVSINPVDYKIMHGEARLISGSKFPKVYGTDFAGIVKEITEGVKGFNPGDRVYGSASIIFGRQGALAEMMKVNAEKVRAIPGGMSFEEAASLPVAALTALNGLRNCKTGSGKRVLVNGATGGVGHFAVQIAKAKGAHVTATCGSSNAELAGKLGVEVVTAYGIEDAATKGEGFDVIMDAYGKMKYADICRLLKKGGIYASTLFLPTSHISSLLVQLVYDKKLTSANMRAKPEDYEEIEKLWSEKNLIPLIENIFPLSKCGDAFYFSEHGKPRGKVVVTV